MRVWQRLGQGGVKKGDCWSLVGEFILFELDTKVEAKTLFESHL